MNVLYDNKLKISGRYTWQGQILYLAYTASYVEVRFFGRKLTSRLVTEFYKDSEGKQDIYNGWIAVFVNDMEIPTKRIELKTPQNVYTLYESDKDEEVVLRLMKFSEASYAKIGIASLDLEGSLLKPIDGPKRRIEYIGDSITSAYGVEGVWGKDTFSTATENPLLGYAYKSARLLNAQYQFVSWSGIGIITNYVEETRNTPFLDRWLMPELYQYSDGELESFLQKDKDQYEIWDNTKYKPDLVVVYIGTNDASYTRGIDKRQQVFAKEYGKFLETVRCKNPDSYILCVLGTMNQELCSIEQGQVELMQQAGDNKIEFLHLPMQLEEDGIATDTHPSATTHTKVAKLIESYCNNWIGDNW